MKRIMIIGNSGAGKSTLSRALHQKLNLPLIHLDQLYWLPAWNEPKKEDWREVVREEAKKESWIMDGNFRSSMDIRLQYADTIIFLDINRWICLLQAIKRFLKYYGKTRPDMTEACPERLEWQFIQYMYHYNRDFRPGLMDKLQNCKEDQNVIILQSKKSIRAFVHSLPPTNI